MLKTQRKYYQSRSQKKIFWKENSNFYTQKYMKRYLNSWNKMRHPNFLPLLIFPLPSSLQPPLDSYTCPKPLPIGNITSVCSLFFFWQKQTNPFLFVIIFITSFSLTFHIWSISMDLTLWAPPSKQIQTLLGFHHLDATILVAATLSHLGAQWPPYWSFHSSLGS